MMEHRNEHRVANLAELAFGMRPAEELYDLKNDPHEIRNLAGNPESALVVKRLDKTLKKWMDAENDIGDPRSVKRRK